MEHMPHDEWERMQDDAGLPIQRRAELYLERLDAAIDWDNLPPEFASMAKKRMREMATRMIVGKDLWPAGFFMNRPYDIAWP